MTPVRLVLIGAVSVVTAGAIVVAGPPGPAGATGQASAACSWTVRALPTISAQPMLDVNAVMGTDDAGTFSGTSAGHAVLWRDATLVDLGPGIAVDVNQRSEAVGWRPDADFILHATLWRGTRPVPLAEPPGAMETRATGINRVGLIVGTATVRGPDPNSGTRHAVVWSARSPGQVRDLGTLGDDPLEATDLTGVTEQGVMVGRTLNQRDFSSHAVVGTLQTGLRELSGTMPSDSLGAAGAAGRYIAGMQGSTAVLWTDGRPSLLPQGNGSAAVAVNRHGTVVGVSPFGDHPQVWFRGAAPVPLPNLVQGAQSNAATVAADNTVGGASYGADVPPLPVLWSCR
jgi:uncharacterized membrane protein